MLTRQCWPAMWWCGALCTVILLANQMLSFPLARQLSGGMEILLAGLIIMILTEHRVSRQTQQTRETEYNDLYLSKLINYLQSIIILVMKNPRVIYGQLNY